MGQNCSVFGALEAEVLCGIGEGWRGVGCWMVCRVLEGVYGYWDVW